MVLVSGIAATYQNCSNIEWLREQLHSVPRVELRCSGPFVIIHNTQSVKVDHLDKRVIGERCVLRVAAQYGRRQVSASVFEVQNREGEKDREWRREARVEFLTSLEENMKTIQTFRASSVIYRGGFLPFGKLGYENAKEICQKRNSWVRVQDACGEVLIVESELRCFTCS